MMAKPTSTQPTIRLARLLVLLFGLFWFVGCGDSNGELTSPNTNDIAAFIEANPEYAAKEQLTEKVQRNPKTGKEETVARPMDIGN